MNKSILNKISTLGIVSAIAAFVLLNNPFNVDLEKASASGYGYGYGYQYNYGSTPNKDSLTLKDDCRVNNNCTKNETTKTEETKNENSKVENKEEVKADRIYKELNNKKYSLTNTSCRISADIANKDFNSGKVVTFKDISASAYKSDIERLARVDSEFNEPIVHGTTPTTYEPNRSITRAEFLAIVLQSHCIDVYKKATSTPFADLKVGDWKTNVVAAALERNIIAGDTRNGKRVFRPNDAITKIEAMAIITSMRDLRIEGNFSHSYTDVAADWQNRVLNLVEYLELDKKSAKFNPNSSIARDMMANYIVKAAELY